jgi:methyl-accepting chemotaxis protein
MNNMKQVNRFSSLKTRVWLILGVLVVTAVCQISLNYLAVAELRGVSNSTNQYGLGRYLAQRLLYVASEELKGVNASSEKESGKEKEIAALLEQIEKRFERLRYGDLSIGVPPAHDPRVLQQLDEGERLWQESTRPLFDALLVEAEIASQQKILQQLEVQVNEFTARVESTMNVFNDIAEQRVRYANNLQLVFMFIYLAVSVFVILVTRSLFVTLGEAVSSLGSGAAEILASTAQQSAGAKEQAAAVAQTSTTVEELLQSAHQTAEKAQGVAKSAEQAAELGGKGKDAVEASIESMQSVKEQSERMAENIMDLAEQAQSIGEIVSTVSEIAEQTNILAINAGIEASRAGGQGSGFGIVAREIKELAYESKRSMVEIRKILGKIQSATNNAVLGVEEGGNRINHSMTTVNHAGSAIDELVDAISISAQAAIQIAAASGQQVNAISQIQQAMKDVNQATHQTVSASKQNEQVAKSLAELGKKLKALVTA